MVLDIFNAINMWNASQIDKQEKDFYRPLSGP